MFVHGYFWNFIISNSNHENAQCVFLFMDPQRSINFSRSVRVFGLTKRNFISDFFQKVLFGLKMWKQTGTKCNVMSCVLSNF